jgi:hypothetical protein
MKSFKLFLLVPSLISLSFSSCENNSGSINDLKGVLEKQKDKSTVQVGVEGSDYKELYFLRNDALHPRILYIKISNDVIVPQIEKFWDLNHFSTTYHKDNGIFIVRYKNSLDSAVLFTKQYLYKIQKLDSTKKITFTTTEDFVIQ